MSTTLVHHTLYAGRAPTVVLIHGMTCDAGDWDSQVDYFTGLGRQVLTMDLRGHGRSMHFDGGFDMPTMAGDVAPCCMRSTLTRRSLPATAWAAASRRRPRCKRRKSSPASP